MAITFNDQQKLRRVFNQILKLLQQNHQNNMQNHLFSGGGISKPIQTTLLTCVSKSNSYYSTLQKRQVSVQTSYLQQQINTYEWRQKTQFPIIKITDIRVLSTKLDATLFEITLQNYPVRLNQLKEVPLFKILYLLKESIIGFERLYDKFGPFLITPKMIAISQQYKCKIWLNQMFASNRYTIIEADQQAFLRQIYKIFEQKSNSLKNSVNFFQELFKCNKFCQALSFIQNYARDNKITIPTSYRFITKELAIKQTKFQQGKFDPSQTLTRTPRFLDTPGLRVSLNSNARNTLLNLSKPVYIKQNQEDDYIGGMLQMKTSGDTAPDIYGNSNNKSGCTAEQSIKQEQIIDNDIDKKPSKQLIFKSQIPIQLNIPLKNQTRKCSSNQQSLQFTHRAYPRRKQLDCQVLDQTNFRERPYISRPLLKATEYSDQKIEQITKININNTYQKNNWQKTLDGLFVQEGGLKTSFHEGKDKRNAQNCHLRLQLLSKINTTIHESYIHNQNQRQYQYHPYTNQY